MDKLLKVVAEQNTEAEYRKKTIRGEVTQLRRIADILDEILRLVKKDMEPRTKKEKE
mgnify:CR=1 FL=1